MLGKTICDSLLFLRIRCSIFQQAIIKNKHPLTFNLARIFFWALSPMESAEIMPTAAVGTQRFKSADDLLDLLEAFAVCQCKHMTKNFLKQLHPIAALVLISFTINILMKICGIVNSINPY